jgi:NAD(P)-dependent dehydrogenase (short-subunit alcohol dehydrogenase family)
VDRFGRLDNLINNAGLAPMLPIERTTPEVISEVFRVNTLGTAYAIHAAWPVFQRQRSGCIINLSTLGTIDPFPGFFAYAAAKAAVNLMTKVCASEGAPIGVRAFAIAPGAVETEMLRAIIPESVVAPEQTLPPEAVADVIAACIRGDRDAENGGVITLSRQA